MAVGPEDDEFLRAGDFARREKFFAGRQELGRRGKSSCRERL